MYILNQDPSRKVIDTADIIPGGALLLSDIFISRLTKPLSYVYVERIVGSWNENAREVELSLVILRDPIVSGCSQLIRGVQRAGAFTVAYD